MSKCRGNNVARQNVAAIMSPASKYRRPKYRQAKISPGENIAMSKYRASQNVA